MARGREIELVRISGFSDHREIDAVNGSRRGDGLYWYTDIDTGMGGWIARLSSSLPS